MHNPIFIKEDLLKNFRMLRALRSFFFRIFSSAVTASVIRDILLRDENGGDRQRPKHFDAMLLGYRSTPSPSGIAEMSFVKVESFHFLRPWPTFVVVDYVVDPQSLNLGTTLFEDRKRIDDDDFDPEGDLLLLRKLLLMNPSSSSPLPKELHVEELKIVKSSIDDPPELKLKDLPSHLEYAFWRVPINYPS
ncbi:hypothetical protein Tco_0369799 [Tanacetum coccineum]